MQGTAVKKKLRATNHSRARIFSPSPLASQPVRSQYFGGKALLDRVLALVMLVVLAPLIGVLALLVKLTSRGPAFYKQTRLGQDGEPFVLYKLRSMLHDCEQFTGPVWAMPNDPRVTPLGRFLRRFHLDELPQLWNVVRGEMSLVGPRPERPEIISRLQHLVPRYKERLSVRPGLTGLAQVQLPADTDIACVRRKLVYDLYYIQSLSFWLDMRILMSTMCRLIGIPCLVVPPISLLPVTDFSRACA